MLNNEKTIRFEDFAAVSQDGGDVLGKVLYYSLSSILIDRDELESLCDAVGFPKGRSNRTAMGDAFRSATGDIYERRVVKTDSGPQIFKVYCRDNKGGNASVISRELVKETVHEDTNEYRKLANITFNKTSKLFSYDNVQLFFTEDALEAVADKAIERNIGARGLRAVMEGILTKVMFDIPSDPSIRRVTITADCVTGKAEPEVVHDAGKESRAAKLKTGKADSSSAPAS